MQKSKAARAAVVLPCFFALNAALSLLNRWSLGVAGFRFPLLLTVAHATFTFCAMLPAVALRPGTWARYRGTLRHEWRGVAVVGVCLSVNIALNNLSLVHISLSLNQVIRASIPLATSILGAVVNRQLPNRAEFAGLVVLCGGVGVAISEATASGNSLGVGICLLSVLAAAAMLDSTARTLAGRVDSVQLAFFTAPVTCACLVPPLLALEAAPFARHAAAAPAASAAILLAGGAFALAYNVVHNELVAITDAVTTCVLGQLKIVMLMVLSAAVLGEGRDFTARMSLGCACAILGFGMYSWAKIQQQAQQQQAAAARKRGGTARTPARGGARAARGSDTETPPRTLAAPATPSGARTALRTPSMRLRTPATTRRTPGRMV